MRTPTLAPIRTQIAPEDFDRGFVELPLSYRRGPAPDGFPDRLTLTVPSYRHVNELVAEFQEAPNPWLFVFACVPEERRDDAFMNLLAYDCQSGLIEASMILCLGHDLYQRIMANTLADETSPSPRYR